MGTYAVIIPELLLLGGALIALFAELLPGSDRGAAWLAAALSLAAAAVAWTQTIPATVPFGGVIAFDGPARFARVTVALLGAIWMLWTAGRGVGRVRDAVSLAMFSLVGCMLMSEARELITLVLSLELAALPAYVLVGYRRDSAKGMEGALKYFLLSVLTTLVTLYGLSFIYGLTGSTRYGSIDLTGTGALGTLALLLALVGMLAKLSAVPFHFWAPDAYSGSTPWAVAFVSTVPKLAGAVAIVRFVDAVAPNSPVAGLVLALVAAVSMVLGNLAALTQSDIRRMMAYSGIAHAGYLLIGVATLTRAGFSAAIFYALAYAIPSMGIMFIAQEEGPHVDDLGGLVSRRPATAWGMVALLVSLVGVPPVVGFFGKFSLIIAALQSGLTALVVLAVVVSVVSAGYYLRIVRSMFFGEAPASARELKPSFAAATAFGACVLGTVVVGLGAGPVLSAVGTLLR